MDLDDLLEQLNETDIDREMKDLRDAVSDMESCETARDFFTNIETAMTSAAMILVELKKIKKEISKRGLRT